MDFDTIKSAIIKKHYPFFERGDFNINLVGLRSSDLTSNRFNDHFFILFYIKTKPVFYRFDCTTDPGVYYRNNPLNLDGTAILKPGHYKGLWSIGRHRGQYKALVQTGPAQFYRDNNKDNELNLNNLHSGFIGLNCHRAFEHGKSQTVNKWSAGCQVIADPKKFNVLMQICSISAKKYGNSFSYTLLNEADI